MKHEFQFNFLMNKVLFRDGYNNFLSQNFTAPFVLNFVLGLIINLYLAVESIFEGIDWRFFLSLAAIFVYLILLIFRRIKLWKTEKGYYHKYGKIGQEVKAYFDDEKVSYICGDKSFTLDYSSITYFSESQNVIYIRYSDGYLFLPKSAIDAADMVSFRLNIGSKVNNIKVKGSFKNKLLILLCILIFTFLPLGLSLQETVTPEPDKGKIENAIIELFEYEPNILHIVESGNKGLAFIYDEVSQNVSLYEVKAGVFSRGFRYKHAHALNDFVETNMWNNNLSFGSVQFNRRRLDYGFMYTNDDQIQDVIENYDVEFFEIEGQKYALYITEFKE